MTDPIYTSRHIQQLGDPPPPPVDRSSWVFESPLEFISSPEPEFQREWELGRSAKIRNGAFVGQEYTDYSSEPFSKRIECRDVYVCSAMPPFEGRFAEKKRAWLNGLESSILDDGSRIGRNTTLGQPLSIVIGGAQDWRDRFSASTIFELATLNPYVLPDDLRYRTISGVPVVDIPEAPPLWGARCGGVIYGDGSNASQLSIATHAEIVRAGALKKAEYDALCKLHDELEVRWLCGLAWLRGVIKGLADAAQVKEQEARIANREQPKTRWELERDAGEVAKKDPT